MCGIGFILTCKSQDESILERHLEVLRRRGPDASSIKVTELEGGRVLYLMSAVLHLRGDRLFHQPAEDSQGNVLLWNGEVFGGLPVAPSESDTQHVLHLLSSSRSDEEVLRSFETISGPFAFVYFSKRRQTLYFGRDPVGRRSLVMRITPSGSAGRESLSVLSCLPEPVESVSRTADLKQGTSNTAPSASSSRPLEPEDVHGDVVGSSARIQAGDATDRRTAPAAPENVEFTESGSTDDHDGWTEVRTDVVYRLDLRATRVEQGVGAGTAPFPTLHAWSSSANPCRLTATPTGSCMTGDQGPDARPEADNGVARERENDDVGRVQDGEPRQAPQEAQAVSSPTATPSPLGLLSEACGRLSSSRDEATPSPVTLGLLRKLRDSIRRRVCTIPYPADHADHADHANRSDSGRIRSLLDTTGSSCNEDVRSTPPDQCSVGSRAIGENGKEGLELGTGVLQAEGDRGDHVPLAQDASTFQQQADATAPARIGVLFSGGLDSVVLAALLAETRGGGDTEPVVPPGEPIDLINVCFDSASGNSSPDRVAAFAAASELRSLFPAHLWRLVCVDASYEDVLEAEPAVWRVMQPCNTAMDFNIATAFWFASKGLGRLHWPSRSLPSMGTRAAPQGPQVSQGPQASIRLDKVRVEHDTPVEEDAGDQSRKFTSAKEMLAMQVGADFRTTSERAAPTPTIPSTSSTTGGAGLQPDGHRGELQVGSKGGLGRRGDGKTATITPKLNKNMEELCPVHGCRHLVKQGCVFGTCSKCCAKLQRLLAPAEPRPLPMGTVRPEGELTSIATAGLETGTGTSRQTTEIGHRKEQAPKSAEEDTSRGDSIPVSGRRPGHDWQRVCKSRAEDGALQALKQHLVDFFEELSSPFCGAELVSLLRAKAVARPVRAGRDVHFLSRQRALSQLSRENPSLMGLYLSKEANGRSVKLCPLHRSVLSWVGKDEGYVSGAGGVDSGKDGETSPKSDEADALMRSFRSEAKVLLVGIGADEYMAGYSRHRNVYKRGGAAALAEELSKDQGRLWRRNLGRDDRCVADHGREARFPYLDEDVIAYLRSLALRDICNMEEPPGVGDKKILRQVAVHLGLKSCLAMPKRAIQFGSRIAQHYARHTYGSHRRGSGSDLAAALPRYHCGRARTAGDC